MRLAEVLLLSAILSSCGGGGGSSSGCDKDSCGLCSADRTGVKICSMVASPTLSEKVVIYNYDTLTADLTGWTLWDQNAEQNGSGAKSLSGNLLPGTSLDVVSLGFAINDTGETIYLKNNANTTVHTKSN